MRSSSLALALALGLLVPAPARAADDAETFFAQGRALRLSGKCGEAVVAFRRALELRPQGLGSLRNIAECEEAIGQFASARSDWWALRRAALQSNEPKYEGWERDAEQAYRRLEPKVARLTIRIEGAPAASVQVSVDGQPLDPRLVGVELERDLGEHTIQVRHGAGAPLTESRKLEAGAREVVTFTVPEAAPAAGPAPAVADGGRPLRIAGIAALGVGGAGLVGLAVSLGIRQSALAAFDVCAPSYQGCPTNLRGDLSRGQTASTLVTAFSVVAAAGAAAAVPLMILGSRKRAPSTTALVSVAPLPGGAFLWGGVSY